MALTKVDISMLEDAGSSGQVLTSDGTNWTSAAAAAGGAWAVVSSGTASAVSSIAFTDVSTTKVKKIILSDQYGMTNWMGIRASTDTGGSPTWDTGTNYTFNGIWTGNASLVHVYSSDDNYVLLSDPNHTGSEQSGYTEITIDVSPAARYTNFMINGTAWQHGQAYHGTRYSFAGTWESTDVLNAVNIVNYAGSLTCNYMLLELN